MDQIQTNGKMRTLLPLFYFLSCVVYQALGQDCFFNQTSTCPVDKLPLNKPTYIHPGGSTGCLESTPYRFHVTRGSNKKLILFFQGGGFCWNDVTNLFQTCRTEPVLPDNLGIFDRNNDVNPFKDWTVVNVLYCSGDAHVGNKTIYAPITKKTNQHYGARNVQSVLDWVRQQNYVLRDLLIVGISAGSVGAQFHSHEILTTLKYKNAAVILDSFVGVLNNGMDSKMFHRHGVCENTQILQWNPTLQDACTNVKLTIPQVLDAQLAKFPNVSFNMITSKTDEVQLLYYGISINAFFPSKTSFYILLNVILNKLALYNNFASYIVQGSDHSFTNKALLYSTFPSGIHGRTSPYGETTASSLASYLKKLPLRKGSSIPSYCFGDKVSDVSTVEQCSDKQHESIRGAV